MHEIELKNQSHANIASLLREEELKWYQRFKSQFILEGDSNTRYFHSVTNGRHRKKRIHILFRMKVRLRDWTTAKLTLPNITKTFLGHQRKVTSLWMNPKQMIYSKFPLRKIIFLRLSTRKRK
jgi:hypothetical protein